MNKKRALIFILMSFIIIFIIILVLFICTSYSKIGNTKGYLAIVKNTDIKINVSFFSRSHYWHHTERLIEDNGEINSILKYISQQHSIRLPFTPKGSLSKTEQTLYDMRIMSKDDSPLGNVTLFGNTVTIKPLAGGLESYYILSKHDWSECLKCNLHRPAVADALLNGRPAL